MTVRKWNLPLTYKPKIEPVLLGNCRQTIRVCGVSKQKGHGGELVRKAVGDLVRFYVWSGRPYWSTRINLTEYEPLTGAKDILIMRDGLACPPAWPLSLELYLWSHPVCSELAALDGIFPATGEELGRVLRGKNNIPLDGVSAQILRW